MSLATVYYELNFKYLYFYVLSISMLHMHFIIAHGDACGQRARQSFDVRVLAPRGPIEGNHVPNAAPSGPLSIWLSIPLSLPTDRSTSAPAGLASTSTLPTLLSPPFPLAWSARLRCMHG